MFKMIQFMLCNSLTKGVRNNLSNPLLVKAFMLGCCSFIQLESTQLNKLNLCSEFNGNTKYGL